MDQFWQAVADFLNSNNFAGRTVVAPAELREIFPIERGHANLTAIDAERIDALVLHKGLYRRLGWRFTQAALARLHPSFANEVFIVLTSDCVVLDPTNPHLGNMPAIRAWANAGDGAQSAPAQRMSRAGHGQAVAEAVQPAPAQRMSVAERDQADAVQPAPTQRMAAAFVGHDQVLAETAFGHLILLSAADRSITPYVIRDGYADKGITLFIRRVLRPGMIYVDVGANAGFYAVLAASCVGESGRVVAIEAIPQLAEMACDNLAMNGLLPQSRVLPFAAASRNGWVTIYEFERHQRSNTLLPAAAKKAEEKYFEKPVTQRVGAKRLTDLLGDADIAQADLLKIDASGYEIEILKGARDFLDAGKKPSLILEWHPDFWKHFVSTETFYLTLTRDFGYSIHTIGTDGQTNAVDFSRLMALKRVNILAQAV
jgi:FkbM family methyltransferase